MTDNLDDEWWIDSKEKDVQDEMEEDIEQSERKSTGDQKTKKKKRNRKKKSITAELNENGDVPATPVDVIDYLRQQFEGKLTSVELDEVLLDKEKHFFKAESDHEFPVAYLKSILPKWKKLKKNLTSQGSPLVLIISSSAIRSVNFNRLITEFKGEDCKCAKLFAKHMKVEDQQKFLKKTVCHIALGTPNRITALLKTGYLNLDKLKAVILDWNWRDVKQRRLMDGPETRQELLVLMKSYLIPFVKSEQHCKIGIL